MNYLITVGLPGSGKSTWAEKYQTDNRVTRWCGDMNTVKIIDCDNCANDNLKEYIKKEILVRSDIKEIIIDGLFTTNKDVELVINSISPNNDDEIVICQWLLDRERCIENDLYRREISSEVSIENLPYEIIDVEHIKNQTHFDKISKENFNVYKKKDYEIFISKYNIDTYANKTIVSDSWSNGGTSCNCWGDTYNISPEEPCEFDKFDKLLEDICPNINFLQYKKIRQKCVSIEEDSCGDYYGGTEYYSRYVCDIQCLYDALLEMNLIKM